MADNRAGVPEGDRVNAGSGGPGVLGLVMLDTRFPRPVGDVGNPATFDVPVLREIVTGATPERIVLRDPSAFLEPFVVAGARLVARGATLVSTSCGFLAPFEKALARALPVPVLASVLSVLPRLDRPAVLTVSREALVRTRLAGDAPVVGLDGTAFARSILQDRATLDVTAAERDHVRAARRLVRDHLETRTIVLECTNMGPYAAAIGRATGRPVVSLVSELRARLATSPKPAHPALAHPVLAPGAAARQGGPDL